MLKKKSNAIVLTPRLKTVGIGAGQMSGLTQFLSLKKKAGQFGRKLLSGIRRHSFPKKIGDRRAKAGAKKRLSSRGAQLPTPEIIKACDNTDLHVFTG